MRVFLIPDCRMEEFEARLVKLTRKADRLGVEPPAVVSSRAVVKRRYENGVPAISFYGEPIFDGFTEVEMDRPVIKLAGWGFLGVLEHTEHGNIIKVFADDLPAGALVPFRDRPDYCDHCKTARTRINTYLVRELATGAIKQVGSTCINDFCGKDVLGPLTVAAAFEGLGDDLELGGGGGGGRPVLAIETVLRLASVAIRTVGWVSAGAARDGFGVISTADVVADVAFASTPEARHRVASAYPKVWAALKDGIASIDRETAAAVQVWARAIPADTESDYLHNVRVACLADYVDGKTLGLVVSAVRAWQKAQEIELAAQAAGQPVAGWLGQVGDKVGPQKGAVAPEQIGEVRTVRHLEGEYGITTLVKVVTPEGAHVCWFASKELEVRVGDKVGISGTIKKLGEYQGRQETVLTRAKLRAL